MLRYFLGLGLGLVLPAAAQVTYDAGQAGNPPTAPSPTTQGWSETLTGACQVRDVSPDPDFPLNAWQVEDPGAGEASYFQGFQPWNGLYEFEVVMRPLAGTFRLYAVAGGLVDDNWFDIELELVGPDVHVLRPGNTPLVCPNAVDGYHSYRLVSGPFWDDAWLFYDDEFLGLRPIDGYWSLDTPGLRWGTAQVPAGRARVHSAHFDFLRSHPMGESYCGPAVPHSGGKPARIEAFGKALWFENDLRLDALDMPVNQFGYFLVSATQGFVANPGGSQGNLCLGGMVGRFSKDVMSSGPGGSFSLQVDLTNLPTSPPSIVGPGDTWSFQAWFRDANPTPTSNFTDGVAVFFP